MYSIGVDFHRTYSDMTVMDAQGQVVKAGKMPNTQEAVHRFVAPYGDDAQAVLEATRNWTVMYDLLDREVRAVYLAHPLKVRAIAEARIKTDRIDSKILAHLLRCDLLPTAYVRLREDRVNQQILRQRMFLVCVRTMVKNRIHVCIDRQLEVREGVAQFTDLFGAAGLTWLRRVALPEVERRLLNAELALFVAALDRETEGRRGARIDFEEGVATSVSPQTTPPLCECSRVSREPGAVQEPAPEGWHQCPPPSASA